MTTVTAQATDTKNKNVLHQFRKKANLLSYYRKPWFPEIWNEYCIKDACMGKSSISFSARHSPPKYAGRLAI